MIDWISAKIPYRAAVVMDQYLKRDGQTGAVEPAFNKGVQVKGSYSSGLMVIATGSQMTISGNPVKWLTGQNVTGPNDPLQLLQFTYRQVLEALNLPECHHAEEAFETGDITFSRVDCTFGYHVGTDAEVNRWMEAMSECCHVRYRGRGHYRPDMHTLYYGLTITEGKKAQGSRRSTFKFYNKHAELQVHPLKCAEEHKAYLSAKAYGIVRGEATFRGQALSRMAYSRHEPDKIITLEEPSKHGLQIAKNWKPDTARHLHETWIKQMEIAEMVRLDEAEEVAVPRRLLSTYKLWKQGENMRDVLSKATFYRHRKDLREFGVDISLSPERLDRAAPVVVPMIKVLEAKPVEEDVAFFWRIAA